MPRTIIEILGFFDQNEYIPPPSGKSHFWFTACKQLKDLGYLEYLTEEFEDESFIYVCKITGKGRKHLKKLKDIKQSNS